jgi:hypothetical protein
MGREDFQFIDGIGWIWWRAQNPTRPWPSCPWCGGTLPVPGPVAPKEPPWVDSYGEGAE